MVGEALSSSNWAVLIQIRLFVLRKPVVVLEGCKPAHYPNALCTATAVLWEVKRADKAPANSDGLIAVV